jgi:hypothetical protein
MKTKLVWVLVALNALLLTTLVGQWLRPNQAVAQFAPQARPSDYIIVPGTVQGSTNEVLFILDTQNGLVSARLFDGQNFQDMAPIALNRIFGPANQGRGRK